MRAGSFLLASAVALGLAGFAAAANAGVLTVQGTANVYDAGSAVATGGGTLPGSIAVAGGQSLTITSTGSITYNGGGNYNDPDGFGSASDVGVNARGSLSGFSNSHAGCLVGVFVPAGGPAGAAPTSLAFTDATTNFSSLSPLLDQVFFIGDGLTGDATGTTQSFVVPANASLLYLGFADAPGYHGDPGSYGDNAGSFTTTVTGTPEPATLGMLAIAGVSLLAKRRRASC